MGRPKGSSKYVEFMGRPKDSMGPRTRMGRAGSRTDGPMRTSRRWLLEVGDMKAKLVIARHIGRHCPVQDEFDPRIAEAPVPHLLGFANWTATHPCPLYPFRLWSENHHKWKRERYVMNGSGLYCRSAGFEARDTLKRCSDPTASIHILIHRPPSIHINIRSSMKRQLISKHA